MNKFNAKTPADKIPLSINFAAVLAELPTANVTILSAVVTISVIAGTDPSPSSMLFGSPSIDSSRTIITQVVQAGIAGVQYLLNFAATCSDGTVINEQGALYVATSSGEPAVSSYSGDPRTSDKDSVRFWIQDTDSTAWLLNDQEILYTLTQYGNTLLAAAACARSIAGRYAKKVNRRVGDLAISYSDLAKNFMTLAEELEAKGNVMGVIPYAGGISVSDMQTTQNNTDVVQPDFTSGQFDNQNATQTPFGSSQF